MNKFFSLFFIFLFFTLTGFCQNSFFNYYPDSDAVKQKVIATHDSGFLAMTTNFAEILLNKFDDAGNNTWSKKYFVTGYNLYPGDIAETKDHGFILTGYFYSMNVIDTYMIFRIDSAGNLIYLKIDSDSLQVSGYSNGMTIAGFGGHEEMISAASCYVDSLQSRFLYLSKADSVGYPLWFNLIDPDTNEYVDKISSCCLSNGNIVIAGFIKYVSTAESYFFVMKFDTMGSLIWSRRSAIQSSDAYITDELIVMDSSLYAFAIQQDTVTSLLNQPHLYKIDINTGNLVWHTQYSFYSGVTQFNSLSITSDNKFSFIGRSDSLANYNPVNIEFDSSGTIVHSKYYGVSPYQFYLINNFQLASSVRMCYGFYGDQNTAGVIFLTLDSLDQSPCLSFDLSLQPPVYLQDTMLTLGSTIYYRINSLTDITANVNTTSYQLTGTDFCLFTNSLNEAANNSFELYPNPTSDQFTITNSTFFITAQVDIFNLPGEKIYSSPLENRGPWTVNCRSFPRGIYFVRVSDTENVMTKKIVVQ